MYFESQVIELREWSLRNERGLRSLRWIEQISGGYDLTGVTT
jgi:hypothetical protein